MIYSKVSDLDITDVVKELDMDHIKEVYEKLGIDHKVVKKFEQKAGTIDPDERAKSVLRDYWREREGKKATRKAILRALEQCELIDSMEKLQKKWKITDRTDTGKFRQGKLESLYNLIYYLLMKLHF